MKGTRQGWLSAVLVFLLLGMPPAVAQQSQSSPTATEASTTTPAAAGGAPGETHATTVAAPPPGLAAPTVGKVGVAMTGRPPAGAMTPGAVCLLCRAAAAAANASIAAHIDSLPYDDLVKLKGEVADALRTKWTSVVTIEEPLDLNALPDSVVKNVKMPKKDFSSLRQKYGIDKLLVIDVASLGISRTYSSYIPTSDPKVVLAGMGYMIDLQSNSYDRVVPLNAARAAEGGWDEPPKYPGLTNAYFQVLELTRDRVLKTFGN